MLFQVDSAGLFTHEFHCGGVRMLRRFCHDKPQDTAMRRIRYE